MKTQGYKSLLTGEDNTSETDYFGDPFCKTVLVVDDEQMDIFLLARALSPMIASWRLLTAADGMEAEHLLQRILDGGNPSLPSLIFSDIRMPHHNGFQFLQWLKSTPEFADIPVVMISSFDDPAEETKALELGAAACLHKPPQPQIAQSLLARLMQGVPSTEHPSRQELPPAHARHYDWPQLHPSARKILLVDDDASVRETLGRVLESEHYQVIFAKNGNEAAAKSVSGQPDIVLLDLNMPERDGWSAFRFMNAARPLLPVIVITARPSQYRQAEQLGVDALMEKPLNLPLLLRAIEGLLSEAEPERARRITDPHFKTALLGDRAHSTHRTGSR